MKKNRNCNYCKKTFKDVEGRIFSNHVRWCLKNPDRQKSNKNISVAVNLSLDVKYGKYTEYLVYCDKCNQEFKIIERLKKFPIKDRYFCSLSCANSNPKTEFSKQKTRLSLKKNTKTKICAICKIKYFSIGTLGIKYCSDKCCNQAKETRKNKFNSVRTLKEQYRDKCAFKFNLKDYKEEFDFSLIEKYGWYNPSTSNKPNLNGVSRDHIISVNFGFENSLPLEILNHPANCNLLRHNDNITKGYKCGLQYKELLSKIILWDGKYGKYYD